MPVTELQTLWIRLDRLQFELRGQCQSVNPWETDSVEIASLWNEITVPRFKKEIEAELLGNLNPSVRVCRDYALVAINRRERQDRSVNALIIIPIILFAIACASVLIIMLR